MGAFKLGKMTFGSLFKKPETVLYPIETKPQPEGLKGHIVINVEDCILCGMCDRSCPTDSITVDKEKRSWEIYRFSCIQCGYCITVCPKKCLSMVPGYAPAATSKAADAFEIPATEKPVKEAKAETPAAEKPINEEKTETPAGKAEPTPEVASKPARKDVVLDAKIAIMDPEKAQRVREALANRG